MRNRNGLQYQIITYRLPHNLSTVEELDFNVTKLLANNTNLHSIKINTSLINKLDQH